MLHRESGVFKTSYAADMALYPLPIARWTVAAIIVLFAVVLPLVAARVLSFHPQPVADRRGRRARPQHPGRIHRPDLRRACGLHVGRCLHGRQPRRAPAPAVLGDAAGRRADGGLDRRHRRHPEPAHQGPLPRHRHAGGPAHHRVDHQSHAGHLRRRAGLHRGAAADALGLSAQDPGAALLFPAVLCRARHAGDAQHRQEPHRPRLRRHPRPGHRRRDHRHQHLPLQAAVVRHLVVLRRRVRRALHLLLRHRQLRGVPDRRVDRLPGHDHHRRARLGARLHIRGRSS